MLIESLPEGCPHIDWSAVSGGFATWMCAPGEGAEPERERRSDVQGQGLVFLGDPHHCQTDAAGNELWAVPLRTS